MDGTKLPNILITGTPGTGKTTHAKSFIKRDPRFKHIEISDFVKRNGCHFGFNAEWKTLDVDISSLLKLLKPLLKGGGCIVDWHSCDEFKSRYFNLIVVLRTNHSILWKRLVDRGYDLKKIQENNEAEIMQVCLDDAIETFEKEKILELYSETNNQIQENLDRLCNWLDRFELVNQS